MGQSWTALLLVLLVLVGAWHSQLGLRVVVEDYVHGAPVRSVTLVLLVLVGAWHSQLGLRVVVEDYVHGAPVRTVTLVLLMFAHVLLAGAGVVAVLRVALGAAP